MKINQWKPEKTENGNLVKGEFGGVIDGLAIGVDPGVNYGITVIENGSVYVYNGKLGRRENSWEHGIDSYELIGNILRKSIAYFSPSQCCAVVEGAAYGPTNVTVKGGIVYKESFGQVGLESVRAGFYLGLHLAGVKVTVSAPKTIRAGALGGGTVGAWDVWPLLNHNAADSLGAALYSYRLKELEK